MLWSPQTSLRSAGNRNEQMVKRKTALPRNCREVAPRSNIKARAARLPSLVSEVARPVVAWVARS